MSVFLTLRCCLVTEDRLEMIGNWKQSNSANPSHYKGRLLSWMNTQGWETRQIRELQCSIPLSYVTDEIITRSQLDEVWQERRTLVAEGSLGRLTRLLPLPFYFLQSLVPLLLLLSWGCGRVSVSNAYTSSEPSVSLEILLNSLITGPAHFFWTCIAPSKNQTRKSWFGLLPWLRTKSCVHNSMWRLY